MNDRSYSIENVTQSTPADTISLIIVDDEGAIRRGLSASVGWDGLGISVAGTAANGAEALTLMESTRPDIVITDIKMPGMDGLEFIAACRERGYGARFIILSGFNDFEFAREAIRYGVRSYLLKPVRIAELRKEALTLKAEILQERKLRSENEASRCRAAEDSSIAREHRLLALASGSRFNAVDEAAGDAPGDAHGDASGPLFPDGTPPPPYRIVLIRAARDDRGEADSDDEKADEAGALKETLHRAVPSMALFRIPGQEILGALLSVGGSAAEVRAELDRIEESAAVPLKFGVGLPVPELGGLRDSYESAQRALGYFMYPESGAKVFADDVADVPSPPAGKASEYGIAIAEKIRLGDEPALERELDDFFDELFFVPMPPPEFVRGMCVYLLVDLERIILETCVVDGAIFDTHPTLIVHTLPTIQDIRDYAAAMARSMTERVARSKRASDPMVERAKEYIRENALKKLRIEDLAERENLSASYFAALFKSCAGESFRDFLIRCKLDRAKILMASGKFSIGEISELLGYEDYRSFNRAFKRHTGYTPSVYRRAVGPDAPGSGR